MATNSTSSTSSTTSDPWREAQVVEYQEVKALTENPQPDITIIDVREAVDYDAGHIPTSLNLPLTSFEKSLLLDNDDFARTYRFNKPSPTDKIILSCRSGRRSKMAQDIAIGAGFTAVRNYAGSWNEWSEKNKVQDDETTN